MNKLTAMDERSVSDRGNSMFKGLEVKEQHRKYQSWKESGWLRSQSKSRGGQYEAEGERGQLTSGSFSHTRHHPQANAGRRKKI